MRTDNFGKGERRERERGRERGRPRKIKVMDAS